MPGVIELTKRVVIASDGSQDSDEAIDVSPYKNVFVAVNVYGAATTAGDLHIQTAVVRDEGWFTTLAGTTFDLTTTGVQSAKVDDPARFLRYKVKNLDAQAEVRIVVFGRET